MGAPASATHDSVEGSDVWVDVDKKMIYVESCDLARRISIEGAKYGPSARDASGNFAPGYAYACRT